MAKNNKRKIPKEPIHKEIEQITIRANPKEIKILSLVAPEIKKHSSALKLKPYVALKYYKSDWQCFSEWESQELKEFSSFVELLQSYTWEQVYNTGNKKSKHGFAYTKYEISDIKSEKFKGILNEVKKEISEDINFFELRVNQKKLRVHGFQSQAVFFLVALDRNHEVFPE